MEKRLGIYIHIPFCASKCGYCDFYSRAGCDELMPDYEDALIAHIRASGKLRLADLAEYNPNLDQDNRSARVAARLVHQLTK